MLSVCLSVCMPAKKHVWKHVMANCDLPDCRYPHCVSTRAVLGHYHHCRDVVCAICATVRETIKKDKEKAQMHYQLQLQQQHMMQQQQLQQQHYQAGTSSSRGGRGRGRGRGGRGRGSGRGSGGSGKTDGQPDAKKARVRREIYPLDPISCALYGYSEAELAAHFATIHEGMKVGRLKDGTEECVICREEAGRVKFEPLICYCAGPCRARIKRNAWIYSTSSKTQPNKDKDDYYCKNCFDELKDGTPLKRDLALTKKKNGEESEEVS